MAGLWLSHVGEKIRQDILIVEVVPHWKCKKETEPENEIVQLYVADLFYTTGIC